MWIGSWGHWKSNFVIYNSVLIQKLFFCLFQFFPIASFAIRIISFWIRLKLFKLSFSIKTNLIWSLQIYKIQKNYSSDFHFDCSKNESQQESSCFAFGAFISFYFILSNEKCAREKTIDRIRSQCITFRKWIRWILFLGSGMANGILWRTLEPNMQNSFNRFETFSWACALHLSNG